MSIEVTAWRWVKRPVSQKVVVMSVSTPRAQKWRQSWRQIHSIISTYFIIKTQPKCQYINWGFEITWYHWFFLVGFDQQVRFVFSLWCWNSKYSIDGCLVGCFSYSSSFAWNGTCLINKRFWNNILIATVFLYFCRNWTGYIFSVNYTKRILENNSPRPAPISSTSSSSSSSNGWESISSSSSFSRAVTW